MANALTEAKPTMAKPDESPVASAVPRFFSALLIFLVVLNASAYWWGSWLAWPGESLSVFAMFRGQDIEAFPLIRGLSSFNAGEAGVLEWLGHGVSARIAPYVLHGALLAVAGPAGFMIADVLLALAAWILLTRLFLLSGVGPVLARAAAALLVCTTTNDFGDPGFRIAGVEYLFWGLRIPRPFVSELFMYVAIAGALTVLGRLRAGTSPGFVPLAAVGVGGSLLLQSDVFAAAGLGTGLSLGIVLLLGAWPSKRCELLRSVRAAGFWATLASVPLLIEMARMPQHAAERLGMFPVSRLQPLFVSDARLIGAFLVVVIISLMLGLADRSLPRAGAATHSWSPPPAAPRAHARWFFALLAAGALLALPVSSVVLGEATQIYHYPLALIRSLWLAFMVLLLQASDLGIGRLRLHPRGHTGPGGLRQPLLAPAVALLLGPCLLATWRTAAERSRVTSHMRTDVPEYAGLHDYRSHFTSLIRELPRSSPADPVVLATFDHQVWSWWLTFGGGRSYFANACTTTLPDEEIERRLAALAKLMGMTRDQFVSLMRRKFMLSFWHSCARYQANVLHTYRPLEDYAVDDRRRIAESRPTDSFLLLLPLSEEHRLGTLFDGAEASYGRLDLIVMTKNDFLEGLAPPTALFDAVYENDVFSMWRRKIPRITNLTSDGPGSSLAARAADSAVAPEGGPPGR